MIGKPYPRLEDLLMMIGDAGRRISEINACEGAAGNISICTSWSVDIAKLFPVLNKITLPQSVPELAGATIIVTGSGRRLREISNKPTANVACLKIDEGGQTASQYTIEKSPFSKVTSEFNSHLAVHYNRVVSTGTNFNAIIHAQPPHLTYLSNIPRYQDVNYLNTHLLRWQPENILNFPEGIGFAPFLIPGSEEMAKTNAELFRKHNIVLWSKHGVMACSDTSIKHAGDRIEYAETAAHYEYLNLGVGEIGEGLTAKEIQSICAAFNIKQDYF